jgi:heavy metal sensor kinase
VTFIHSIKFKFTLWYLVVLLVLLLLLGAGVYLNLSRTLNAELDHALRARTRQLISIRNVVGIIERGRFEDNVGEIVSFYIRTKEGIVAISPRNRSLPVSDELVNKVIKGRRVITTMETVGGDKLRVFAVPYMRKAERLGPGQPEFGPPPPPPGHPFPDGLEWNTPPSESQNLRDRRRNARHDNLAVPADQPAALFVARSTQGIDAAMHALLRTLMLAIPLTLLIAGGGGIFLAGRVLRPVEQIASAAREIEENDLGRRIEVHTKDELGSLATTLNDMIERLETAFERQKQFTGDASHELRTPLAVIEAEATLALSRERNPDEYRASLATVVREAEHMSCIIDQLLELARADAGRARLAVDDVMLSALLQELSAASQETCAARHLSLTTDISTDVTVNGDGAMLKLLFQNLIANAIRYTPDGGSISVSLVHEGNEAVARISDTGIGIPANDLLHIFDRFYRVDKARSRAEGGSGLGLSICKQIVELHGGSISVASEVGRGSAFTVRLA